MFVMLAVLFISALLSQIFVGYAKYNTFSKLRDDVEKRIVAADQST